MTQYSILDLGGYDQAIASLSGAGTVTNNGTASPATLTISGSSTTTFSGTIQNGTSTTALTLAGAGTNLTLSGTNTYSGGTTLTAGTLAVGNNSALGTGTVTFNGGTLQAAGASSIANAATLNSGTTSAINNSGTNFTLSGAIGGSGNLMIVDTTSGGALILTNADNNYTGTTTIGSGAGLTLTGSATIASSSNLIDNGAFTIGGVTGTGATITTLSGNGGVTLGSKNLTISDGSTTFTGAISGGGGVILSGGTETLSGASTYVGGTTIDGGTLIAGASTNGTPLTSGPFGTNVMTISGGTLRAGGDFTIGNDIALGTGTTNTIDNAGYSFTISGLFGGGNVTFANSGGGGETILTGGGGGIGSIFTINSGATLALSGSAGINQAIVADNGTFSISGVSNSFNTAVIAGLNSGGTVALGANTLVIDTGFNTAATNFSGTIGGTGGLAVLDSGPSQTLSGQSTFSGGMQILLGTLVVGASSTGSPGAVISGPLGTGTLTFGGLFESFFYGGGTLQAGDANLTIANAATLSANMSNTATGTLDNNGYAFTYSGAIGGGGNLVVANSGSGGSVILTNSGNNYTGSTTINSGATLALSGSGSIASSSKVADGGTFDISAVTTAGGATITSLSGSGGVTLGTNTLTLSNADDTFGGNISGSGGLTITSGSETLTGANAYTGATTFNAIATLALSGSGSIADSSVVVANGVFDISGVTTTGGATITSLSGSGIVTLGGNTLTLSSAGDTFAGIIDGAGGLTVASGVETLTETNTYSGPTTIDGALVLSAAGSIARSSDVIVNGELNIATLTAAGTSITSLDGSSNGEVILGTKTLTLTSASGTFAGDITGSGGLTLAAGTETLSGMGNYTGPTTINGGTLIVTGSIADTSRVDVFSSGMLTGTGIIDPPATTIHSGGTFAPGTLGVPGTFMTITGNLAFQSGAIYAVYLNPSTSSYANVTGTASLAGTVNATFLNGSYLQKAYTILQSAGLGGTTFNALTTTNLPAGFLAQLTYSGGNVLLDLAAALPNGGRSGLNVNQTNVANALDHYFNSGGTLPPSFLSIFELTGGSLANALSQLSGEASVDAEFVAFEQTSQFLNLMLDPYVDGRLGSGGAQPMAYAPEDKPASPADFSGLYGSVLKTPPAPLQLEPRWTAWGASYGGANMTNGNMTIGSTNVSANIFAVAGGMDYHYSPDAIVGFALAGGGTNWDLASAMGNGRSDAFQAGVYATTRSGPASLSAALAFANNWFTINRSALGDILNAGFAGQSYGARVEGDYRLGVLPTLGVTPYAALQAQAFHTPSYSENDVTGTGFGLSYAAMTATDIRSELGARFDSPTLIDAMPLLLRARVGWAHDWVSNPSLNAAFESLPGTNFVVNGAAIPQNSTLTSLGAQLFITPHLSVLAKFDGEFAPGSQTYAGSGTVRYTW